MASSDTSSLLSGDTLVCPSANNNKLASIRPPKANNIIGALRRTFSSSAPSKRASASNNAGMFSTAEESWVTTPSRYRVPRDEPNALRPTIEQIAMGLHTSRTPHFPPSAYTQASRPPHRRAHSALTGAGSPTSSAFSQANLSRHRSMASTPPKAKKPRPASLPPPKRSSLKQPDMPPPPLPAHAMDPPNSPMSSTSAPPATASSAGAAASTYHNLKARVSHLLRAGSTRSSLSSRVNSLDTSFDSPLSSATTLDRATRKSVRFSDEDSLASAH